MAFRFVDNASRGRSHPSITEGEWERMKPVITDLYLKENLQLTEVQRRLAERFDFHASQRQYVRRLDRWNARKYTRKHNSTVINKSDQSNLNMNLSDDVNGVSLSCDSSDHLQNLPHIQANDSDVSPLKDSKCSDDEPQNLTQPQIDTRVLFGCGEVDDTSQLAEQCILTSKDPASKSTKPPYSNTPSIQDLLCNTSGDETSLSMPFKSGTRNVTRTEVRDKNFACPFTTIDPYKFRKCTGVVIRSISVLKQHLSRIHRRPDFYCSRCFQAFDVSEELGSHLRQRVVCELQSDNPFTDAIDSSKSQILSRRSTGSAVDIWFDIFSLLFPNHTAPPSPFIEDMDLATTTHILNVLRVLGPEALQKLQQSINIPHASQAVIREALRLYANELGRTSDQSSDMRLSGFNLEDDRMSSERSWFSPYHQQEDTQYELVKILTSPRLSNSIAPQISFSTAMDLGYWNEFFDRPANSPTSLSTGLTSTTYDSNFSAPNR